MDHRNRTAAFGIMIGEPACRGKGYGTETSRLMLDYTFTGLLLLAPAAALGGFRPLELGELVEDAVGKLPLWAVVATIVEGFDLCSVGRELLAQQIQVRGFTSEPVAVLCEHSRYSASGYEIPYAVHARPLEAGAALPRVYYLLEDLVALSGSVLSKGFDLLGE